MQQRSDGLTRCFSLRVKQEVEVSDAQDIGAAETADTSSGGDRAKRQ